MLSSGSESWNSTASDLANCNLDKLSEMFIVDPGIVENIGFAICNLTLDDVINFAQISVEEIDVENISERVSCCFSNATKICADNWLLDNLHQASSPLKLDKCKVHAYVFLARKL